MLPAAIFLLPLNPNIGPATPLPVGDPTTGIRACNPCGKVYAAFQGGTCPSCDSHDTRPFNLQKSVDPAPLQQVLFVIPPAPTPDRWRVEWRWDKKRILKAMQRHSWWRPEPEAVSGEDQVWHQWGTHDWASLKSAKNTCRRLRSAYKGKSFRIRPVHWEGQP